jgi:hypothetical protein
MERVARRRRVQLQDGDVVILREPVPSLRKDPTNQWRFRLSLHPATGTDGRVFNTFQHAAGEGEGLASHRQARLIYVEDDAPSLLNDYRAPGHAATAKRQNS